MKRLIIILGGLIVTVLITSSCSALEKPQDRDLTPVPAVTKAEEPEIQFPELSSRDAELYVIDCIEYRFLVLLHILVVGEGKTFHHSEKRHIVAENTSSFTAYEFRDIWVLFLRHYA